MSFDRLKSKYKYKNIVIIGETIFRNIFISFFFFFFFLFIPLYCRFPLERHSELTGGDERRQVAVQRGCDFRPTKNYIMQLYLFF